MTELELRNNLIKCSKLELIDMLIIQYKGLGTVQEQIEEALKQGGEL